MIETETYDTTDDSIRGLRSNERTNIQLTYPNINIDNVKHISEGFLEVEDASNPLCQVLYCMTSTGYIVNFKANNTNAIEYTHALNADESIFEDICVDNLETECLYSESLIATFNCIGWGLGITKWLSPYDIDTFIENGSSPKEAISKFITSNRELYPETHPSNMENILDKLTVLDEKPAVISNNTVMFFFKDQQCTHASRYVTSMDGVELNQWTSKAGTELLFSHDESETLNVDWYGDEVYYAGITEDNSFEL